MKVRLCNNERLSFSPASALHFHASLGDLYFHFKVAWWGVGGGGGPAGYVVTGEGGPCRLCGNRGGGALPVMW